MEGETSDPEDDIPLSVLRESEREAQERENECKKHAQSLQSLLDVNGLKVVPTAEDGNCLFHSVVYNYRSISHMQLRKVTCAHIKRNAEYYKGFLTLDLSSDFDSMIDDIGQSGAWNSSVATNLLPLALSNILQKHIVIFSSDATRPFIDIKPSLKPQKRDKLTLVGWYSYKHDILPLAYRSSRKTEHYSAVESHSGNFLIY